jgi:transcriptional regulator with XRE-family HTH domain
MAAQGRARFHVTLKAALGDHKQVWLADRLGVSETTVSRWMTDKTRPLREQAAKAAELLGEPEVLEVFDATKAPYELYLASPISGLRSTEVAAHRDAIEMIATEAETVTNGVYWPGRDIHSKTELAAADIVTRDNLEVLRHCHGLLYVQLADVTHPTGALVELGIALGRQIKTTVMIKRGVPLPFMLRNFEGVAARSPIMPDARVDFVDTAEDVVALIKRNGREIFGLS